MFSKSRPINNAKKIITIINIFKANLITFQATMAKIINIIIKAQKGISNPKIFISLSHSSKVEIML